MASNKNKPEGVATYTMEMLSDGLVRGTDGTVWLYFSVPLGPVVDAKSEPDAFRQMITVSDTLSELSRIPSGVTVVKNRKVNKSRYRKFHLQLLSVAESFEPPPGYRGSREFLMSNFPGYSIDKRQLLLGVQLIPQIRQKDASVRQSVDNLFNSLMTGIVPIHDFDDDIRQLRAIAEATGLRPPTRDEMERADSWWSGDRNPAIPYLVHPDHLHFFQTVSSARTLSRLHDLADCSAWAEDPRLESLDFYQMSFWGGFGMALEDGDRLQMTDPTLTWASEVIEQGARVVSIRGLVEPVNITRTELRKGVKRFRGDEEERYASGKQGRVEQEAMTVFIEAAENDFASNNMYPVICDTSIVIGVDGDYDLETQALTLVPLTNRQEKAWTETMLCSTSSGNPHKLNMLSTAIAASGITSLSIAGDREGALVGFTQHDRQPAYLSSVQAADEDNLPMVLCAGQTGSGKTMLMLWLAVQFAQQRTSSGAKQPVVIIDPKPMSDHTLIIEAYGGRVYSLDTILNDEALDGPFDPLRIAMAMSGDSNATPSVESAANFLISIFRWDNEGSMLVYGALRYGVERGARCLGSAMNLARSDPRFAGIADQVLLQAQSSEIFRACVGMNDDAKAFSLTDGLTLIKVGNSQLSLPNAETRREDMTLPQVMTIALFRMMVLGTAQAVSRNRGVVMLDEAWMLLTASEAEIDALARLARSQGVLPMLFTQKVSDASMVSGSLAQALILPISDRNEAIAACELAGLEPTEDRLARITASASIAIDSTDISGTVNYNSMRALRDPKTGAVLRGSIAIYADSRGRAVPVEIQLPPRFLEAASTRPEDIKKRDVASMMRGTGRASV
jgi:hypothetical protein